MNHGQRLIRAVLTATTLSGTALAAGVAAANPTTAAAATAPAATAPAPLDKQALARTRIEVCKQAVELAMKLYSSGLAGIDLTGQWSHRLIESQRAAGLPRDQLVPAIREHVEQMKRFESAANRRQGGGSSGKLDALSATYFRLEAEGWLAEAEGK